VLENRDSPLGNARRGNRVQGRCSRFGSGRRVSEAVRRHSSSRSLGGRPERGPSDARGNGRLPAGGLRPARGAPSRAGPVSSPMYRRRGGAPPPSTGRGGGFAGPCPPGRRCEGGSPSGRTTRCSGPPAAPVLRRLGAPGRAGGRLVAGTAGP